MIKNGTMPLAGGRVQKYKCRNCRYESHEGQVLRKSEPVNSLSTGPLAGIGLTKEPSMNVGLTEEQFRNKYDLSYIINKKCKELKEGIYLPMLEFIRFCGIQPGTGYRQILDHPDFEIYRGKIRGECFWSHPSSIKKMKSEGLLM